MSSSTFTALLSAVVDDGDEQFSFRPGAGTSPPSRSSPTWPPMNRSVRASKAVPICAVKTSVSLIISE